MTDEATEILSILAVLARLAQAADDRDVAGYAECLAPRIRGASEDTSDAERYASAAIERVSAMDWTHHKLLNPVLSISGDRASARIDLVVDMARTDACGIVHYATMGGRYDLDFVRMGEQWRIERRVLHRRYVLGDTDLVCA
ncbi:nuclear transport factor 2 family protein [Xanthobacteraceae bacterium Astr-EGSB]|uniref:nuclear transport factor 2 family protein n=1 Tax=Astrobacterium formosum TaxID=3069710 RepID=UPI0027B41577|nr:nuclear transport factor 2 family protein [Xanthobacteraceae bacterium Astr-EGSB]